MKENLSLFIMVIFVLLMVLPVVAAPVYKEVSNVEELYKAVESIVPDSNDGAYIKIKPGVYLIEKPLYMKNVNMVKIEGSGWNTLLKKVGDGDLMVFEGICWHNRVTDLMFEGDINAKTGSGLVIKEGKWNGINTIERCYFLKFPEHGVKAEGKKDTPISSITVKSCWFIENKEDQLYFAHSNDYYILENQFGRGGKAGCYLYNSSAGSYSLNYHWDNKTALKMSNDCHFTRIENNRFEESYETGIIMGDKNDPSGAVSLTIFTGNTIHSNSKNNYGKFNAVEMYNIRDIIFNNNQIFSWNFLDSSVKHCLTVSDNSTGVMIKDNIFRHHTEDALIYPKDDESFIVKDNMIDPIMPKK